MGEVDPTIAVYKTECRKGGGTQTQPQTVHRQEEPESGNSRDGTGEEKTSLTNWTRQWSTIILKKWHFL